MGFADAVGRSDTFEPPYPNYDATKDRDEGKPPPGIKEEILDSMFSAFATLVAERATVVARSIGMW